MNENAAQSCQHCGAMVFPETKYCPQCGKFPVIMHYCPVCKTISGAKANRCQHCGRMFQPDGDYFEGPPKSKL